jgi:hypothetical protein
VKSFSARLPSWQQIWVVFLAVLAPVSFWSLFYFFRDLPSYLLRMKVWDILGVFAYAQIVVILDALLLLVLLILAGLALPRSRYQAHFTQLATLVGFLVVIWVIPYHYLDDFEDRYPVIQQPWFGWLWLAGFFVLLAFLVLIYFRMPKLAILTKEFLSRLTVLSAAYLILAMIAGFIILLRVLGLR